MKTSFEFPEPDNSKQDINKFAEKVRDEVLRSFFGRGEASVFQVMSFAEGKIKEIMIREKWIKREDLY